MPIYYSMTSGNLIRIKTPIEMKLKSKDASSKRFKTRRYYLPKGIIKNYNIIIYRKSFCYQAIDSDIKQCEKIRDLTTGQGEDYPTGCFLDYYYMKNHYSS